jgi:hypothetical protein
MVVSKAALTVVLMAVRKAVQRVGKMVESTVEM